MTQCIVNKTSSRVCEFGIKGCDVIHLDDIDYETIESIKDLREHLMSSSDEDRTALLYDLLDAIESFFMNKNADSLRREIDEWEATLELNTISGLRERVLDNYGKERKNKNGNK